MRTLLIVLLLASTLNSYAQKWDYQWLFGYDVEFSQQPTFGLSLMDFNNGEVTIDYWDTADHDLGSHGSFVCNRDEGELQLFTNGCYIWDQQHESITGNQVLIDDWPSEDFCPEYYPGIYSKILLPEVSNDSVYYMVHTDDIISDVHGTVVATQLIFNYVKNNGEGFVLEQSTVVLDTFLQLGHMTAMLNAEQDKWWLSVTGYETNRHFIFLIGGTDTISEPIVQEIGGVSGNSAWDIGQATYSPNGQLYANSTEEYGIMLFDFDNATGVFSNYREIHYPNMETAEGLAFSPNNRFIYVTTAEDFYQIDLEATDSIDQVYHIDHVRSYDPSGWPIGLGYMHLGPDCRLYISPGTTTHYMHVVQQPDQKGAACQFEENAINTLVRFAHFLPNIPNYHYPRGCDSSIAWGLPVSTSEEGNEETKVRLFPNPTQGKTSVELGVNHNFDRLEVYDLSGYLVHQQVLNSFMLSIDLDMSAWPAGVYILQLTGEGDPQSLRLVKR